MKRRSGVAFLLAGIIVLSGALLSEAAEPPGFAEVKLLAGDTAGGDFLGWSVSMDGNVAVLGAPFDNENGPGRGSVSVFRWSGTAWIEE